MDVSCECYVFSGSGLCDGTILRLTGCDQVNLNYTKPMTKRLLGFRKKFLISMSWKVMDTLNNVYTFLHCEDGGKGFPRNMGTFLQGNTMSHFIRES